MIVLFIFVHDRQPPLQAPMYATKALSIDLHVPINELPSKRGCGRFCRVLQLIRVYDQGASLMSADYLEQQDNGLATPQVLRRRTGRFAAETMRTQGRTYTRGVSHMYGFVDSCAPLDLVEVSLNQ